MTQTIPPTPETKPREGLRKAPGPRSLPPLGSAPAFARDIEGFSLRMWQRYGDLVRVRFLLWPGYLLYHPDHVKHVLHDHHRNYNKQSPLLDSFRLFFGNGLFTNNGESWLHQRRLIEDLSIYWQSGPIHASQAHRHELLHKPCLNRYSGSGRF